MREAAALARAYGVSLHTHLAENANDVAYSREKFGATPAEYVEELGWVGQDVWHAHCVQLDERGIGLFGADRDGRGALPVLEHAARVGHRAGAADARLRACRSAWASTARPRTMPATCWARRARRCCCSASATGRTR